jgi:hypothetical protein
MYGEKEGQEGIQTELLTAKKEMTQAVGASKTNTATGSKNSLAQGLSSHLNEPAQGLL